MAELGRQQQEVEAEVGGRSRPGWLEVGTDDCRRNPKSWPQWIRTFEALQSVLREDMGYGRQGMRKRLHLKPVTECVMRWPNGWSCLRDWTGRWKRFWASGSEDGSSIAVSRVGRRLIFLRGRISGGARSFHSDPRWTTAGIDEWWPAIAGQPGVVGRAVDLVQVEDARTAARDYLFDRVVFVEHCEDAMLLVGATRVGGSRRSEFVTRAGEVLDAAGIVTGGQVSATGGLLQRRREVINLEARRTTRS